ncbi:uncharacterized protein [Diadema setosum]|uniref:uncharacterized protein n=1 Tax=Diadema setosum TaxID=31175 RepID=UPI003B3A8250
MAPSCERRRIPRDGLRGAAEGEVSPALDAGQHHTGQRHHLHRHGSHGEVRVRVQGGGRKQEGIRTAERTHSIGPCETTVRPTGQTSSTGSDRCFQDQHQPPLEPAGI